MLLSTSKTRVPRPKIFERYGAISNISNQEQVINEGFIDSLPTKITLGDRVNVTNLARRCSTPCVNEFILVLWFVVGFVVNLPAHCFVIIDN